MASKQVTSRKKSAEAVTAAANTHAARVAKSLEHVFTPYLEKDQKMPDVEAFMLLLGKWVGSAAAQMVTADEAHVHELSDDEPARIARDKAHRTLSNELVSLREWMTGLFGGQSVKALGFASDTPRDSATLSSFAGEVVKSLREKTFPAPKREGSAFVPTKEANKIQKLRQKLDVALTDVARETREAQGTLADKNAAMEKYDDSFSRAANCMEGLFLAAGETALADRVKPSPRRPGQTDELAEQSEPDETEEPTEPKDK